MRFQHALIQFQRSHIHALLLTLRKVAMSIRIYNTKWPFDLNNMSREMNKLRNGLGTIYLSIYFAHVLQNECFRDEKYSTHRYISYLL